MNPDVILNFSQTIVILPTGERILYTTSQTVCNTSEFIALRGDFLLRKISYPTTITVTILPK
jgi:hypothetical protein